MNKRSVFIVISQWNVFEVIHTHEVDKEKAADHSHESKEISTAAFHAVGFSSTATESEVWCVGVGVCWQRHTLPHRRQCSTIRARRLNFRVRNETGCTPTALATNRQPNTPATAKQSTLSHNTTAHARTSDQPATPHHIHGKPSTLSTGQLRASLRLHPPPI